MKINLDELVQHQIIDQEVADRITTYYSEGGAVNTVSKMIRIISIIAVTLLGLGLMLIIAYNWDTMSKPLRLGVAVLPLIVAQVLGGFALWKSKNKAWKESTALSMVFGIGIAMALITQIYQMDGSLADFLKWWIILSIPLIYLFDSGTTSLAVWIGIGWYLLSGNLNKDLLRILLPLLFMCISIIPYCLKGFDRKNSATWTWHHWLIPVVLLIYFFTLTEFMCDRFLPIHALVLALAFSWAGHHPYFDQHRWLNGYHIIAIPAIWIIAFVLSFEFFWSETDNKPLMQCIADNHWLLPVITLVTLAGLGYYFLKHTMSTTWMKQLFWMAFILILVVLFGEAAPSLSQVLVNLIILGSLSWMIYHGIQTEKLMLLNMGLLALAIWIICRFFETDISFAWRGLIFIALGILCFTLNYVLLKRKKS